MLLRFCRFKQAQENRVWTGKLVEEPYTEYILSLYHAVMVRMCRVCVYYSAD